MQGNLLPSAVKVIARGTSDQAGIYSKRSSHHIEPLLDPGCVEFGGNIVGGTVRSCDSETVEEEYEH